MVLRLVIRPTERRLRETSCVKIQSADASPAEIRETILPEDQPEFDRQWQAALAAAALPDVLAGYAEALGVLKLIP